MPSTLVMGLAVVPWAVEAAWLRWWVPLHARRLRKQRSLEAVFGPGYFDMTQPQSEVYWQLAFILYHVPAVPVVLAVPLRVRVARPWLAAGLMMGLTPAAYSGIALWLGTAG